MTVYDYYRPRVLLYVSEIQAVPDESVMLCLKRRDLYILRNIVKYAYRRANWVQTMLDNGKYVSPQASAFLPYVNEMETRLMTDCNDYLQLIAENIEALQCICNNMLRDTTGLDNIKDYLDDGVYDPGSIADDQAFSGADPVRCGLAQACFAMFYEIGTEWIVPIVDNGFMEAIPLLAALLTAMVSGPAAVPVYIIVEIVTELMEVGFDMAISNFINWLLSVKDDLICEVYNALPSGTEAASSAAQTFIDDDETLGSVQKQVLKMVFGTWLINAAKVAQAQSSDWYNNILEAGACDDCTSGQCSISWTWDDDAEGWTGDATWGGGVMVVEEDGFVVSPLFALAECTQTQVRVCKNGNTIGNMTFWYQGSQVDSHNYQYEGWLCYDLPVGQAIDQIKFVSSDLERTYQEITVSCCWT